jgi:hypothetical protein
MLYHTHFILSLKKRQIRLHVWHCQAVNKYSNNTLVLSKHALNLQVHSQNQMQTDCPA